MAAAALLGAVVIAGAAGGFGGGGDDDADEAPSTVPTTIAAAAPVVVTEATTAPPQRSHLPFALSKGNDGNEVQMVQVRLKELGFEPGPIDGQFGDLTRSAVWAFEKLVLQTPRSEATGRVTDEMWQRMQDPLVIMPRRPDAATADHTEIYLPEQVVIFFVDDTPALISHMSSGTGDEWCEEVTISPGEYGNEDGTEPLKRGECGRLQHPRRRVRVLPPGRRCPPEWPRRHVEPRVLQLRHRHPRRAERAAGAGVARMHPHPDVRLGVLPGPRRRR